MSDLFPDAQQEATHPADCSRRSFMQQAGGILGLALASPIASQAESLAEKLAPVNPVLSGASPLQLSINGQVKNLILEPRVTLLDALREHLDLTGTKKGCDHGQCGACTVHVDGRRTLACLTLAVATQGTEITTIEGLAPGDALHPMQAAFLQHDGFQCGYCTHRRQPAALQRPRANGAGAEHAGARLAASSRRLP